MKVVVSAPQVEIGGKVYGMGFPLDLPDTVAEPLLADNSVKKAAAGRSGKKDPKSDPEKS